MSLTRLLAIAMKEVVQILRDTRSLIIVVLMPVVLVLLFGYGVNLDLKGLPVYVLDQDGSQASQDLLKHFQASEYFYDARVVNGYAELTRAIDDGHAKMGIVIPWDFSQRLSDGRPVEIQALVDGSDDNTANVLIGYSEAVVQGYSLAGDTEQPIAETAPSGIAAVDSVQCFQPSLLIQVFRDRPVAPNEVKNEAVDLVKMAIDGGTPGGAVAPFQNGN